MTNFRRAGAVVVAVVFSVCGAVTAQASAPTLPPPGTAAQIAALVAKSTTIVTLPSVTDPTLSAAAHDLPGLYYPTANKQCTLPTQCVFGDVSSTKIMVLFGDSHAQMWLPSLVPVATQKHLKLILIWRPGCPEVSVTTTSTCGSFRTAAISAINKLHAALVLLANKNTDVAGPGFGPFSNVKWQAGQVATIKSLATSTTKVAVVGDLTEFNLSVPSCLASYPTSVQHHCAVTNPNPRFVQHMTAEHAAATATNAYYIPTQPWICLPKRCSPVIGNMIAYFDGGHVSATYAEYLSNVWLASINKIIP